MCVKHTSKGFLKVSLCMDTGVKFSSGAKPSCPGYQTGRRGGTGKPVRLCHIAACNLRRPTKVDVRTLRVAQRLHFCHTHCCSQHSTARTPTAGTAKRLESKTGMTTHLCNTYAGSRCRRPAWRGSIQRGTAGWLPSVHGTAVGAS